MVINHVPVLGWSSKYRKIPHLLVSQHSTWRWMVGYDWNISFIMGFGPFSGAFAVRFREGTPTTSIQTLGAAWPIRWRPLKPCIDVPKKHRVVNTIPGPLNFCLADYPFSHNHSFPLPQMKGNYYWRDQFFHFHEYGQEGYTIDPTCDSWLVGFGCWFDVMTPQTFDLTKVFWLTAAPFQWSFLVPLIGGRYHLYTSTYIPLIYHLYTTYIPLIYIAYWVIIYHLPPIKGTRNSYWPLWFSAPPGGYRDGFQLCSSRAQIWGSSHQSRENLRRKLRNDWLEHPPFELKYISYIGNGEDLVFGAETV